MGEWRRPYEVNRLSHTVPVLLFLVVLCLCFNGVRPFFIEIDIQRSWWLVLLNPWFDVFALWTLVLGWLGARSGVFVGDAGVMVRRGFRRTVVPWPDIAYAEVAEVPKFPVLLQRGPALGLVLVAPSGERRPLPARLAAGATLTWGRGKPFLELTQEHMTQVVNRINELAPGHRQQPWPPSGGSLFPPR